MRPSETSGLALKFRFSSQCPRGQASAWTVYGYQEPGPARCDMRVFLRLFTPSSATTSAAIRKK